MSQKGNGREMATKNKYAPSTKIIDGKRFTRTIGVFSKREAIGKQQMYHSEGYRARVVKIPGVVGYYVYIRGLGYV